MYYGIGSCLLLLFIIFIYRKLMHSKKRKARQVVMIALLTAISVIGNLLSFPILPLQMGTAMVILTGVSFGPEAGFLVGSFARLICNFFQGQGPWTPWEMFSWGLLGVFSGIIFQKISYGNPVKKEYSTIIKPFLSVLFWEMVAYITYLLFPTQEETSFIGWRLYAFGFIGLTIGLLLVKKRLEASDINLFIVTFFMVFVVYGGIMNICALLTSVGYGRYGEISLKALRLLYVSGAPYDFWHALRAGIAVFLLGPMMLKRLERVKIKYGFYR